MSTLIQVVGFSLGPHVAEGWGHSVGSLSSHSRELHPHDLRTSQRPHLLLTTIKEGGRGYHIAGMSIPVLLIYAAIYRDVHTYIHILYALLMLPS